MKDRNGHKMEIKWKDVCKRLYETVQSNPRLASLVRSLHLDYSNITEDAVRLIRLCKNVEKIRLTGCSKVFWDDLKAALAKTDLISLDLYSFYQLCSISEFVGLLQNWPRIERVYANLGVDWDHYDPFRGGGVEWYSRPQAGACSAVRMLSIDGGVFTTTDFKELAIISPKFENLTVTVENDCGEALQHFLQSWSSSLRILTVNTPLVSPVPKGGGCPVIHSPMVELQELSVSSPMFRPETFALAPKLEKLKFFGEHRDGIELAQRIEKGELPCLKVMYFYLSRPLNVSEEDFKEKFDETYGELRRVCEKRNVSFVDRLTPEGDYDYEESGPGDPDNN